MADLNKKYFVTEPRKVIPDDPSGGFLEPERATRMIYLDNDVIEGAFYVECAWFWPADTEDKGSPAPHTHDYGEVLAFFGTNPDDPHDLCGEVELWIDGEQNILDKSFLAFIPAGTTHCPLIIRRVDRPIFHFATGPGKTHF